MSLRWTDSVPDLKNSESDPLIESLLEPTAPDKVDADNRAERSQNRHDSVFALFPQQSEVVSDVCLSHAVCVSFHVSMKCSH